MNCLCYTTSTDLSDQLFLFLINVPIETALDLNRPAVRCSPLNGLRSFHSILTVRPLVVRSVHMGDRNDVSSLFCHQKLVQDLTSRCEFTVLSPSARLNGQGAWFQMDQARIFIKQWIIHNESQLCNQLLSLPIWKANK